MGYFDGNTVTALWNYAQHNAMSDNSDSTYFGPSTVGAIDLISGQTRSGNIDIDIAAGPEVGNFRVAATYKFATRTGACGFTSTSWGFAWWPISRCRRRAAGSLLNLLIVQYGWLW
jgi:hypothetical protein